jgi:hypothetical protein
MLSKDTLVDWLQLLGIIAFGLGIIFTMAAFLNWGTEHKRKDCIAAGYTWDATKYVCTVNPYASVK